MRRLALRLASVLVVSCAISLAWAPAARGADATPEQLQFAAQEHDLGYRAYVAKQFEEAATHFENAYFAAPNPAELRSAIRARHDAWAGSPAPRRSRPSPSASTRPTLRSASWPTRPSPPSRPKVFEVHVTSTLECNVAVDAKVVTAEKATDFRFFVDPGPHELLVGWGDERNTKVSIDATGGGSRDLKLDAAAASAEEAGACGSGTDRAALDQAASAPPSSWWVPGSRRSAPG